MFPFYEPGSFGVNRAHLSVRVPTFGLNQPIPGWKLVAVFQTGVSPANRCVPSEEVFALSLRHGGSPAESIFRCRN